MAILKFVFLISGHRVNGFQKNLPQWCLWSTFIHSQILGPLAQLHKKLYFFLIFACFSYFLTCSYKVPSKMAHCAIIPELFMANDALRMKVQLCKISAESEKVAQKIVSYLPHFYTKWLLINCNSNGNYFHNSGYFESIRLQKIVWKCVWKFREMRESA